MPRSLKVFENMHCRQAVDAFRTQRQRVYNQVNLVKDASFGLNGNPEVTYVNGVDVTIFSQDLESFQVAAKAASHVHNDGFRIQRKNGGGPFFQTGEKSV
jgi:hypothetical protein